MYKSYINLFRCVLILDKNAPPFKLEDPFYSNHLSKDFVINVYKNGKWGTYRHLKMDFQKTIKTPYAYVNALTPGNISSLTWIQGNYKKLLDQYTDSKLLDVHYSALNFRDIMIASGKLATEVVAKGRFDEECVIGLECSGIGRDGKRYMGYIDGCKAISSIVPLQSFMWEIPDSWTLEEAATIPVVYGTVIYGLFIRGQMQRGESILIHCGSGGVGQAAIHMALHYNCTIFTTVGTAEKRNFLLKTFPQLSEKNIGNSRDTSFEQLVMRETNGLGVDLVLNSLAEEKLLASVGCLAKGGRFIEIGKFDLSNNHPLSMELFMRGASFHGINLSMNPSYAGILNELMKKEIKSGAIKPLARTVFNKNQIETAFRFMASGKHIGKVLIKIREDNGNNLQIISREVELLEAKPTFWCSGEESYLLVGGLGGFGLELADWLIMRGAKNIILSSTRGISNGYQDMRINFWKSYGVKVIISKEDVTTDEGVMNLLKLAETLGPLKGIFNLAAVLKDAVFEDQTIETFQTSFLPKGQATVFLDRYSRKLCPNLEHFVVFSSTSCGRGNAGQTNYGLSNSVMERLCEMRQEDGLPGSAIQWGMIGQVGLVAEMLDENSIKDLGRTEGQKINSCLNVLEDFLIQPEPIMGSRIVSEKTSKGSSDNIIKRFLSMIGVKDLKTVSNYTTLAELGLDSMLVAEFSQILEREFELFYSKNNIYKMTIGTLIEISSLKENGVKNSPGKAKDDKTTPVKEKDNFTSNETSKDSKHLGKHLTDSAVQHKYDLNNLNSANSINA